MPKMSMGQNAKGIMPLYKMPKYKMLMEKMPMDMMSWVKMSTLKISKHRMKLQKKRDLKYFQRDLEE